MKFELPFSAAVARRASNGQPQGQIHAMIPGQVRDVSFDNLAGEETSRSGSPEWR